MTGWTTAVLVEIVIPPFESVDVTGTKTATGVVGRAVAEAGKGVITMLLDGSNSLAGSRKIGTGST